MTPRRLSEYTRDSGRKKHSDATNVGICTFSTVTIAYVLYFKDMIHYSSWWKTATEQKIMYNHEKTMAVSETLVCHVLNGNSFGAF